LGTDLTAFSKPVTWKTGQVRAETGAPRSGHGGLPGTVMGAWFLGAEKGPISSTVKVKLRGSVLGWVWVEEKERDLEGLASLV
jgi:hypothetical protein